MDRVQGFYSLIFPLPPKAWKRPCFNKRMGAIFDSNQKSINAFLPFIAPHIKDSHPDPTLYTAPIELRALFIFKRAKDQLKKKDKSSLPYFVTKTPDIDNLCKLILDLFSKRIVKDDRQVVKLSAMKIWGTEDCVHVSYKKVQF